MSGNEAVSGTPHNGNAKKTGTSSGNHLYLSTPISPMSSQHGNLRVQGLMAIGFPSRVGSSVGWASSLTVSTIVTSGFLDEETGCRYRPYVPCLLISTLRSPFSPAVFLRGIVLTHVILSSLLLRHRHFHPRGSLSMQPALGYYLRNLQLTTNRRGQDGK